MDKKEEYLERIENALLSARNNMSRMHQHDIARYRAGRADREKLRIPELIILKALWRNDNVMTASELAEKTHVSISAITQQLNALERRHLVERLQSREDRRIFFLRLSKKGRRILDREYKERRAFMEGLLEFLGPEDSEKFADITEKITEYFNQQGKED